MPGLRSNRPLPGPPGETVRGSRGDCRGDRAPVAVAIARESGPDLRRGRDQAAGGRIGEGQQARARVNATKASGGAALTDWTKGGEEVKG